MTRFIHTADWQLGKGFGGVPPELAPLLRQQRLDTVANIARLAQARDVSLVLVAGDVFDVRDVPEELLRRTFRLLGEHPGLTWVLLPGNHDAADAESVWERAQRLNLVPANVHLAITPELLLLDSLRVAVLPAPLRQRHAWEDLTAWYDTAATPDGYTRIGLAHGSVTGHLPEDAGAQNPIAANRASTARLDYLALGDWHGVKEIDARTWYCGTPESDRFRRNESGFVLLVDAVVGKDPVVELVPVGRHGWHVLDIELHDAGELPAVIQRIKALGEDALAHLTLTGSLDLQGHAQLDLCLQELAAEVRWLKADGTGLRLAPSERDLEQMRVTGWLQKVVDELRGKLDDPVHGSTAKGALREMFMLVREGAQ